MASTFAVVEPNRLAISPIIDGRLDDEEWDALSSSEDLRTFMQWEPGAFYFASEAPSNRDVVFSLDTDSNGWLVGKGNLEVRLSWVNGGVKSVCRMLDATNPQEPTWISAPWIESTLQVAGTESNGKWIAELKVIPLDMPSASVGRTIGIRADAIDPNEVQGEAIQVRRTTPITLRYDRSKGLPSEMEWAPELMARTAAASEQFRLRMTFRKPGTSELDRISCRTLGLGRAHTVAFEMPFPHFDKKGRAFVDYQTKIAKEAGEGYRVMEARIQGKNGEDVMIQSSYAVTDIVTVEPQLPEGLVMLNDNQIISGTIIVRSHSSKALKGKMIVTAPDDWSINKGQEHKFTLYNARGYAKLPIKLIAPQRAQGLVPLTAEVTIGDHKITKKFFVLIR
ncbi:MAG: hypothetical protein K8R88_09215 [Armatimonadetes bacterium]|nr:hypothetical protein [Armatimonadota bacterium]